MQQKNQLFLTYTGVVEFLSKKDKKISKAGEEYWVRDLAVSIDVTNPKYPVTLVFNLMGKQLSLVEGLSKGMDVAVTFTIKSKSYVTAEGETKYFLSLNLIGADYEGKPAAEQKSTGKPSGKQQSVVDTPAEEDDLPF